MNQQEALVRSLKDNIYKICARWTKSYSIPRFYRTPIDEEQRNSNKLVESVISFCKYLEEKHNLPKNSLIYEVFGNDQYNDLVVASYVEE